MNDSSSDHSSYYYPYDEFEFYSADCGSEFNSEFSFYDPLDGIQVIQLTLEMDISDSKAMESINSSDFKVINDTIKRFNESESKRYVTVEFDSQDLDTMRKLMSSGVKVYVNNYAFFHDSFEIAMKNNSFEMAKMLVEFGAVDVNAPTLFGARPLLSAARAGQPELCNALIEAGSNVNQKDNGGHTALMRAAENGHEEVVRILIEAGSDLNQKDKYGYTAFIDAAREGHEKAVRILIEADSDVNQKNIDGYTALMLSARYGHAQTSRILLENGADFTAKDSDGRTVLDWAKKVSKDEETIELLEYAIRLHRSTLFIQSIEYLRNHGQEYEEEEVREYIPDHVMNGFFRNTIWKKKELRRSKRRRK